jgi:crossover junction endodeoxyribonuclease RuvC
VTARGLGLDISLSATGVAFPSSHCLTVKPVGGPDDHGRRLWSIQQAFSRLSLQGNVNVAVIEAYAVPKGPASRGVAPFRVAEVGGLIRARLFACGIPWVEIPAPSLKKWATGKGTAQKDEMIRAALNAGAVVSNDNEADAWWLRHVGETFYNAPIETWAGLEDHQQELLSRVNWPKI